MLRRLQRQDVKLAEIGSTEGEGALYGTKLWFRFCTVVVLSGLETMLDSDLIGDRDSSLSVVFIFCFSGALSSAPQSARLHPPDGSQLRIERADDDAACFCDALLATFCFSEFCCDGESVLSCS